MSRRQRRVRDKRRRHAEATRGRKAAAGGMALAATLLTGSVAHAATFHVTNTYDSGTGSLRTAITDAQAASGNTIVFDAGATGTIDLQSALPTITKGVTITGPGAEALAISGRNQWPIFTIGPNATTEIDDLTLEDGVGAHYGGAVGPSADNSSLPLTLENDDFEGNRGVNGGAVTAFGTLTVTGSTFRGNSALSGSGGGLELNSAKGTIQDSTFYDNSANAAGAVFVASSSAGATITGSTIVGNTAVLHGGGVVDQQSTATVQDSIVSGNTSPVGPDVFVLSGATFASAFSLFGTLSGSGVTTPPTSDIVGQDPKLDPPGDNGGETPTMLPQPGSPVIDVGSANGLTADQRGFSRPTDLPGVTNASGGDGSDIGAVEVTADEVTPQISELSSYAGTAGQVITLTGTNFTGATAVTFGSVAATSFTVVNDTTITATVPAPAPSPAPGTVAVTVTGPDATGSTSAPYGFSYPGAPLTVTTNTDSGPGSLRDVIDQANTLGGSHQVTFAAGVSGAIHVASDLPEIDEPLSITGPGADTLTVDGATKYALLEFATAAPVSVSGLTITGGRYQGIAAEYGSLTVDDVDVTDNSGPLGGGLYVDGTATINASTISGNTAESAGGVFASDSVLMTDSTVTGNTASHNAGGIGTYDGSIVASTVTGNHSTYGTAAPQEAGGIAFYGGAPSITDSIVAGNTAAGGNPPDIFAAHAPSVSFSLIGDLTGSQLTSAGTNIVGEDPKLGPLQDNGGPTPTMLPALGSPVIDAGIAAGVADDQRGDPRTVDAPGIANAAGGDGTDIGAVERQTAESLPLVTGISPATGAAGTTVTITGSSFTGATQVLFGGAPATSFTVSGDGQITAVAPAGSGSVDVRVVDSFGPSAATSGDRFTYPSSPTNTTTTTQNQTPLPKTTTLTALFRNQKITLTTPATSACTTLPITVALSSAAVKGSKAKPVTFAGARFYIDRGVKHTRRRQVHGKTRKVTTYTPNLTVHKATSFDTLKPSPGVHTLKIVISYTTKVTSHHHTRKVTVKKTITTRLDAC